MVAVLFSITTCILRLRFSELSVWKSFSRLHYNDNIAMFCIYEGMISVFMEFTGFAVWYSIIFLSVSQFCWDNRSLKEGFVVEEPVRNILDGPNPQPTAPKSADEPSVV